MGLVFLWMIHVGYVLAVLHCSSCTTWMYYIDCIVSLDDFFDYVNVESITMYIHIFTDQQGYIPDMLICFGMSECNSVSTALRIITFVLCRSGVNKVCLDHPIQGGSKTQWWLIILIMHRQMHLIVMLLIVCC